jgi:D-alanyl-D-alanine dipeptidase
MMNRRTISLAAAALLAGCHVSGAPEPASAAGARQLVVVTTADWNATQGTLRRFERSSTSDEWHVVGTPAPIVTGRTGLAWGVGFDSTDTSNASAPHKREGDGKSPAGAFPLDTVFGFAPRDSMRQVHMPYVPLTSASDCVDDEVSAHYNTVVSRTSGAVDWSSAEHMREIGAYRIGVIVGYNAAPPVKGRGSCIFLHIWGGPQSTTAGCTALDAAELSRVIAWLDAEKRPTLVQLPVAEYERLRVRWSLPVLQ